MCKCSATHNCWSDFGPGRRKPSKLSIGPVSTTSRGSPQGCCAPAPREIRVVRVSWPRCSPTSRRRCSSKRSRPRRAAASTQPPLSPLSRPDHSQRRGRLLATDATLRSVRSRPADPAALARGGNQGRRGRFVVRRGDRRFGRIGTSLRSTTRPAAFTRRSMSRAVAARGGHRARPGPPGHSHQGSQSAPRPPAGAVAGGASDAAAAPISGQQGERLKKVP